MEVFHFNHIYALRNNSFLYKLLILTKAHVVLEFITPINRSDKQQHMGKVFPSLDQRWRDWIGQQHLFFVSTAPLSGEGLINCSPKGLDSFRIIDEHTVAYLDLTGSGIETIAHLRENRRISIMFCAFEGPPKILRLYGQGTVLEKGTSGYQELRPFFPDFRGERSIIKIEVQRIQDSCGYAVPEYEYKGERDVLLKWVDNKGDAGVEAYIKERNSVSLDGLPGIL
ncbi:MAG: pyridoxamine 5'-phosphate oxidase [Saprospiraceae bacterium]|nr:MAG: pyridoxamine 5'-phosphate oxidase [Saprospiraceae bacterium]